jgi:D-alanyl-D-alanine carboxypeptidase/D-alanyl-D-alanine-endopeptidase (penicillin-binding protein 4)
VAAPTDGLNDGLNDRLNDSLAATDRRAPGPNIVGMPSLSHVPSGASRPRPTRRSAVVIVMVLGTLAGLVAGPTIAPAAGQTSADGAAPSAVDPITPVLSARRLPGVLAASQSASRMQSALAPILAQATPTTCLTVASGGRAIQRSNGDLPVMPASTEKLLTATALLDEIGADTKMTTAAVASTSPVNGVIDGDLYVVGGGDPLLITSGFTSTFEETDRKYTDYAQLADAIKNAGVTEIRGGVVGDGSRFDDQKYVPTWPARYIRKGDIGPIGGLSVNDGFTGLSESPTVSAADRKPGEPALLAAATLISLLTARGVTVAGGPSQGHAPNGASTVASLDSLPLVDTIGEMVRQSDNTTAETLLKDLAVHAGRTGSTEEGAKLVQDSLNHLGLPTNGSVTVDGSGLDLGNRVTCDLLVAALDRLGPDSAVANELPVAGRTGTLRKRMRRTPADGAVRAKTGTLNEVAALAGFIRTPSGENLTFAVIINGTLPNAVDLTDQVAVTLAQYGAGVSLDQLGPRQA